MLIFLVDPFGKVEGPFLTADEVDLFKRASTATYKEHHVPFGTIREWFAEKNHCCVDKIDVLKMIDHHHDCKAVGCVPLFQSITSCVMCGTPSLDDKHHKCSKCGHMEQPYQLTGTSSS